jgi:hypothetical protein
MATQVRRFDGDRHDVAGSSGDVSIAARAQVALVGLVRLNSADLHLDGGGVVGLHAGSAEEGPRHDGRAGNDGRGDKEIVPGGVTSAAPRGLGIEAHGSSIAASGSRPISDVGSGE